MRGNALLAAAFAALLVGFGCSKPGMTVTDGEGNRATVSADGTKTTYTDSQGKSSTVEAKPDGSVSIKADDGKSSYEGGTTLTEEELGVPFYPGSAEKPNTAFKADTPTEQSRLSVRTTSDDPAKVAEFYKGKVKDAKVSSMAMEQQEMQLVHGKTESGGEVTVTATRQKGSSETEVNIATVFKKTK